MNATEKQIQETIKRLNDMGEFLTKQLGVTNWLVARNIPESFKTGRAHLLQDGILPDIESLSAHVKSVTHMRVVELAPKIPDWMTMDTVVTE